MKYLSKLISIPFLLAMLYIIWFTAKIPKSPQESAELLMLQMMFSTFFVIVAIIFYLVIDSLTKP